MDFLAGLPQSIQEELREKIHDLKQMKKERARIQRARLQQLREEKFRELLSGTSFEIQKVFLPGAPGGRLNDFVEVSDPATALHLLEEYRKMGHRIKLYSLTLVIDGKKWKKYSFTYKS